MKFIKLNNTELRFNFCVTYMSPRVNTDERYIAARYEYS